MKASAESKLTFELLKIRSSAKGSWALVLLLLIQEL